MPTVLDAAGAPIPDTVDGRSLVPLAAGEQPEWRGHLHGEHWSGRESANHYLTDGRHKFCWFSQTGVEQLFDTEADPQERHDLIDDPGHQATADRLRGLLIQELLGREEGYTDGEKLIVGRRGGPVLSHIRRPD